MVITGFNGCLCMSRSFIFDIISPLQDVARASLVFHGLSFYFHILDFSLLEKGSAAALQRGRDGGASAALYFPFHLFSGQWESRSPGRPWASRPLFTLFRTMKGTGIYQPLPFDTCHNSCPIQLFSALSYFRHRAPKSSGNMVA